MKKLILIGCLVVSGCYKTEKSEVMTEDAVVADLVFAPSQHGSGITNTFTDGKVRIGVTSIDVPEKYAVVFKCRHGKFIVQGETPRYKQLWSKFTVGDKVRISFREIYRNYSNGNRTLVKYDFLDAQEIR